MDDEIRIRQIPPHSEEAEKAVIGAMLLSRDAILAAGDLLVKNDFYSPQYGVMFEVIKELADSGKPVDAVTVQAALAGKKEMPELSDTQYLRSVIESVPTAAAVRTYAKIVKDKSDLRNLISVSSKIVSECYGQSKDTDSVMSEAERLMVGALMRKNTESYTPIGKIVSDALDAIERASKTTGHVTGLESGFKDLDYMTSGFQNSDLVLVAARPSMGKTAFVLNIAEYIAFRKKLPCALFSLEMSSGQLMNRLFSLESKVDSKKIREGHLSDDEWVRLMESAGDIYRSNLIIDDTPGMTLGMLRSKARQYKMEKDIKIIFIDYLQLMTGDKGTSSRQEEVSEISRSLKSLARELNIPIIALSQLNRGPDQREDHRPVMSDLRESGSIEQDADMVMFLYRDDYYNKEKSEKKGIAEVIIAKQRNGPIGSVDLVWLPDYTKFADPVRRNREKTLD